MACVGKVLYNTAYHGTKRMTHFKALYGRDPLILLCYRDAQSLVEDVNNQMKEWNLLLDKLKANLVKA